MKKIEYKIEKILLTEKQLNDLGSEGWELITFSYDKVNDYQYIFKREKTKQMV